MVVVSYKVQRYRVRLVKDGRQSVALGTVDCFDQAREVLFVALANLPHEEIHLIMLGGRSQVLGVVKVSQGGLHGAAVTARDVLAPCVAMNAAAFIMGHNHPSGDPTPSFDDLETTKHIKRCADLLGIPMLDHIVVCPEKREATSILNP